MLEVNKIYCCDVLEGLSQLDNESIDIIITSPPYNKAGLNGVLPKGNRTWTTTIDYGGNVDVDKMDESEYEDWQVRFLEECFRVLKPYGSMFYNHKNRIVSGAGEIISPYAWLFRSPFKIRQEIIWDRGSTNNVQNARFLPTTEQIYWLAKSERPKFKRNKDSLFKTEVWKIQFSTNTAHPAPFPLELPNNIIESIPHDENTIVLDPFMGSGTSAIAAIRNGCKYIGFEKFQEYIDMSNNRIKEEMARLF